MIGTAVALGWVLGAATPAQARPAPTPAVRPAAEVARRAELDRAFEALRTAPDPAGAALVEGRIRQLWAGASSPAAALLLRRGARNLAAGLAGEAVEDLDAALVLDPDYAEGWALRAEAQAQAGAPAEAARDLQQALRLEPRHWPTLLALARLQEERGDLDGARRSLEAALAIHPQLEGGQERLRQLRRKAEGEAL